jgi:hypothetical protein
MSEVLIKIEDELEESTELIARSIIHIAESFEKIEKGALSQRAIILLIHDACGGKVGKTQIELVLKNISKLRDYYIKDIH